MTVLTFFIIISMTLSGQQVLKEIGLPGISGGGNKAVKEQAKDTLTVGLNQQGEILVDGKTVNVVELSERMVSYLESHPEGVVVLKADSKLAYEKVASLLEAMREIGGDRVSLAVQQKS